MLDGKMRERKTAALCDLRCWPGDASPGSGTKGGDAEPSYLVAAISPTRSTRRA